MRRFALLTGLTLGGVASAGIAGLAATAVVDNASSVVIAVVVALAILVVGLLEWTHRRQSGLDRAHQGADLGASAELEHLRDRDTLRALDEIRAARAHQAGPAHSRPAGTPTAGTAHGAVSHALRAV